MTYSPQIRESMEIPVEPAVLSVFLTAPTDGTVADQAVYVPWRDCRLAYAYVVTTVAEGNKGTVEIDLELNAASGTEIYSIQVAQNAAIGDIDEVTCGNLGYTTAAASQKLDSQDPDRDAINIEVDGANTTTWEGNLFMYFVKNHV